MAALEDVNDIQSYGGHKSEKESSSCIGFAFKPTVLKVLIQAHIFWGLDWNAEYTENSRKMMMFKIKTCEPVEKTCFMFLHRESFWSKFYQSVRTGFSQTLSKTD